MPGPEGMDGPGLSPLPQTPAQRGPLSVGTAMAGDVHPGATESGQCPAGLGHWQGATGSSGLLAGCPGL